MNHTMSIGFLMLIAVSVKRNKSYYSVNDGRKLQVQLTLT